MTATIQLRRKHTRRLSNDDNNATPTPLFSYSIESSSNGLLANNKVVKVSTLLSLLLDLADDGAQVLDVLFDSHC